MAQRIRRNYVSRKNAWRIYNNVWLPAGRYPLSVTAWTKKECEKIMSPFMMAILPKLGFNRHMPRAVIHGAHLFGGMQMAHFFVEQGYAGIKLFLGHIREESVPGNQIMIALSQAQLLSGSFIPFLENMTVSMEFIPECWLCGLHRYLRYCDGKIVVPKAWCPKAQRLGDKSFTDTFSKGSPSTRTLVHLKLVRLYLGVLSLADICSDDGKRIQGWALEGSTRATPTIPWPNQQRPGKTSWTVWRKFLRQHFATKEKKTAKLSKGWKLDTALGEWLTESPYTVRDSYYHQSFNTLFIRNKENTFDPYKPEPGTVSRFTATADQPVPSPPKDSIFHYAPNLGTHRLCTAAVSRFLPSPTTPTSSPSFQSFLLELSPHQRRLLGNLFSQDVDADFWIKAIANGTVTIASDGSVKNKMGSYAVILSAEGKSLRFQGPVDCEPEFLQSYRAELTGILAIYYLLDCLLRFGNSTMTHPLSLHVDNISAVSANNRDKTSPGTTAHTVADFDLLSEIRAMQNTGIRVKAEWVEAHQDTKYPDRQLDAAAKLNCVVDHDATTYLASNPPAKTTPLFPECRATLMVGGKVITSKLKETLLNNSYCSDLRRYILRKTGWTAQQFEEVAWSAQKEALLSKPLDSQVRIVKFQHNWLPVGSRRKLFNGKESSNCPHCNADKDEEDWQHLFSCPSDVAQAVYTEAVCALRNTLLKCKTAPLIQDTILFHIQEWLQLPSSPTSYSSTDELSRKTQLAANLQSDLGWSNVLKGRIVSAWGEAQQVHIKLFHPTSTKYTRSNWEKEVVLASWAMFEKVWKARNDALHREEHEQQSSGVLNSAVKQAFHTYQHAMSETDKLLFHLPLADRLATSAQSKQHWLAAVDIAVNDFTTIHKRHPSQRTISQFFSPRSQPYTSSDEAATLASTSPPATARRPPPEATQHSHRTHYVPANNHPRNPYLQKSRTPTPSEFPPPTGLAHLDTCLRYSSPTCPAPRPSPSPCPHPSPTNISRPD